MNFTSARSTKTMTSPEPSPRTPPSPTDEELAAEALAGSATAYRQLVERFQRPVLALIRRMVRDPDLAEDLAQESFVRAFQNLSSFKPERSFSSWLFKIAHNRTIDHLRLKKHQHVPLEAGDADGDQTWEVLEAPDHLSPERRVVSRRVGLAMDQALGRLKPTYREALLLRFHAGLSYQDVADSLGISLANVKVLLHRARKQLMKELEDRGFHPGDLNL